MNRIKLLSLLAVAMPLLAIKAGAADPLPIGPVKVQLTASFQQPDIVTLSTNKTSTGTNITTKVTSSVAIRSIVNADILRLLANSFTNLSTGIITNGQLATDALGHYFVVAPASTNDVSAVLSSTTSDAVSSGTESVVKKSPSGSLVSETEKVTATMVLHLKYDDSSLTTRDGKRTSFAYDGLLVVTYTDMSTAPKFGTQFTCVGQGAGITDGKYTVFSGTMTGNVKGDIDQDDPL